MFLTFVSRFIALNSNFSIYRKITNTCRFIFVPFLYYIYIGERNMTIKKGVSYYVSFRSIIWDSRNDSWTYARVFCVARGGSRGSLRVERVLLVGDFPDGADYDMFVCRLVDSVIPRSLIYALRECK